MGAVSAKLFPTNDLRITLFGLDAPGKTTFLYRLKLGETVQVIPTIGFNVETVTSKSGQNLTMWDVGGGCKIRPLWRHYAEGTHGIFYIVDSNDRERLGEACDSLHDHILMEDDWRGKPLVVVANKQDLPNAAGPEVIAHALKLHDIKDRKWHVQCVTATTGEGINEAVAMMESWAMEYKKETEHAD